MTLHAICPVRDQPHLTAAFLEMMRGQAVERLLILDNGSKPPSVRLLAKAMESTPNLDVMLCPGDSIYAMWNAGVEDAEEHGASIVAVLNNDVELKLGALEQLAGALEARRDLWAIYPDDGAAWDAPWKGTHPVRLGHGVARQGGLYGPAFLVHLERIPWRPLITDLSYEHWFGDDHLARQIEETGGKHGRLVGVPVKHENEGTAKHHPETIRMRDRDRVRWRNSQRNRGHSKAATRRMPPGTRVWTPGGRRRDDA